MLLLSQEIEKEKAEKEKVLRGEVLNPDVKDERAASPVVAASASQAEDVKGDGSAPAVDVPDVEPKAVAVEAKDMEGDVKMEA